MRSARTGGPGRSGSSVDRVDRTSHWLRSRGVGSGRFAGDRRRQQRRVPHGRARRGPDRHPLHARQPPPRGSRDRLHPRRLRAPARRRRCRPGARRAAALVGDGRVTAGIDPVDGVEWIAGALAAQPAGAAAGPAARLDHALHVGDVGAARRACAAPPRRSRPEEAANRATFIVHRFGIDLSEHVGDGVHLVTSPLYHAAPISNAVNAWHTGHLVVVMERFDAVASLRLIEQHRRDVDARGADDDEALARPRRRRPRRGRRGLDAVADPRRRAVPAGRQAADHRLVRPRRVRVLRLDRGRRHGDHGGRTGCATRAPSGGRGPAPRCASSTTRAATSARASSARCSCATTGPFEYLHDPAKTAANRRGDFVTVGDLGSLDADGYLYLADRRTDLILSGGVNVYPAEIEAALLAHPGGRRRGRDRRAATATSARSSTPSSSPVPAAGADLVAALHDALRDPPRHVQAAAHHRAARRAAPQRGRQAAAPCPP